jgi:hypothetical protein
MRIEGIAIFPVTYAPHQEGWRDWPEETPATPSDLGPRKVPTPAGVAVLRDQAAWKMWEELRIGPPPTSDPAEVFS